MNSSRRSSMVSRGLPTSAAHLKRAANPFIPQTGDDRVCSQARARIAGATSANLLRPASGAKLFMTADSKNRLQPGTIRESALESMDWIDRVPPRFENE
jgi:hypothetical protein